MILSHAVLRCGLEAVYTLAEGSKRCFVPKGSNVVVEGETGEDRCFKRRKVNASPVKARLSAPVPEAACSLNLSIFGLLQVLRNVPSVSLAVGSEHLTAGCRCIGYHREWSCFCAQEGISAGSSLTDVGAQSSV